MSEVAEFAELYIKGLDIDGSDLIQYALFAFAVAIPQKSERQVQILGRYHSAANGHLLLYLNQMFTGFYIGAQCDKNTFFIHHVISHQS